MRGVGGYSGWRWIFILVRFLFEALSTLSGKLKLIQTIAI